MTPRPSPSSRRLLALLAALSLGLSSPALRAQNAEDRAAAEVLFQAARKLLAEGKVAEACEKFEASNRLDPAPGTLLNLADCLERDGRTASAWVSFREASTAALRAGDERRSREAEGRAKALEAKLSRLTVDVPPELAALPGLLVSRDGKAIDRALWKIPLPVDPGKHVITATAQGHKPWRKELEVTPGAALVLPLPMLTPEAPAPAPTASTPAPTPPTTPTTPPSTSAAVPIPAAAPTSPSGTSGYRVGALAAGGLGILGVAVGAFYGVRASSRWDAAKTHCRQGLSRCDAEAESLSSEALRAGNTSTVAFAAGGLLVAAGAVLWWLAPPASAPRQGRISPELSVHPGQASLSFKGIF